MFSRAFPLFILRNVSLCGRQYLSEKPMLTLPNKKIYFYKCRFNRQSLLKGALSLSRRGLGVVTRNFIYHIW
jgi:hypothetical protein